LDDLQWSVLQYRPDVVFLYLGMNDCADGAAGVSRFADGYARLITQIREHDPSCAIVLQTPNRIMPDPLRSAHLPDYVTAIRDVAAQQHALLIDHHAAWESAEAAGTMSFWLSDAIHPNECGHRALAHLIFRELNIWNDASRVCRLFVP
jgi:lysophospholipase L1-like esterase